MTVEIRRVTPDEIRDAASESDIRLNKSVFLIRRAPGRDTCGCAVGVVVVRAVGLEDAADLLPGGDPDFAKLAEVTGYDREYLRGLSDGFSGLDTWDEASGFGSRPDGVAYHLGVEDGEAARLELLCPS